MWRRIFCVCRRYNSLQSETPLKYSAQWYDRRLQRARDLLICDRREKYKYEEAAFIYNDWLVHNSLDHYNHSVKYKAHLLDACRAFFGACDKSYLSRIPSIAQFVKDTEIEGQTLLHAAACHYNDSNNNSWTYEYIRDICLSNNQQIEQMLSIKNWAGNNFLALAVLYQNKPFLRAIMPHIPEHIDLQLNQVTWYLGLIDEDNQDPELYKLVRL